MKHCKIVPTPRVWQQWAVGLVHKEGLKIQWQKSLTGINFIHSPFPLVANAKEIQHLVTKNLQLQTCSYKLAATNL